MAAKTAFAPPSNDTTRKKLIVLSAPRSGTSGLYHALRYLGYTPYHMTEVLKLGANAITSLNNGFDGELGEGRRYMREDFDKWFAGYDVIIEMPFWMLTSMLQAYPDAQFLLVERIPEKWAASVENTIWIVADKTYEFPMSIFKYFDATVYRLAAFSRSFQQRCTGGWAGTPQGHTNLVNHYKQYIASVKRLVPPEQLDVIKLEDGYGWEAICACVGAPVPNVPWPNHNNSSEFKEHLMPIMQRAAFKGMAGLATMSLLLVGLGWALQTGRLPLPFKVMWN